MKKTISTHAGPELNQRWRQQIARQQRRRAAAGPRPIAAVGYRVHGPILDGWVELHRLVFVTLFD